MQTEDESPGRVDRVSMSQSMAAPEFIPPPEPDADLLEEVLEEAQAEAEKTGAKRGRFGVRRGGKHVETQTSIERVREMVNAGSLKNRIVNISVFFLMAALGLLLIAKAMSPAALEGGVKEGRTVVNDVLKQ